MLRPGVPADAEAAGGFCQQRIAAFERPREFRVVDARPESRIGKILRRGLRARAR